MEKQELMEMAVQRLSRFLSREFTEKDLDLTYDSLGADSMDMVVLAFELEKKIGKPVEPEIFLQHASIRAALDDLISR